MADTPTNLAPEQEAEPIGFTPGELAVASTGTVLLILVSGAFALEVCKLIGWAACQ